MNKTIFFFLLMILSISEKTFSQSPDTLKMSITETSIDMNDLQPDGHFRNLNDSYIDVDYTDILYPVEPWNITIRSNLLSSDYIPQFIFPLSDEDVFIIRRDGTIDVIDTVQRKLIYTLHNKFQIGKSAGLLNSDGSVNTIYLSGSEKKFFWLNGKLLIRHQSYYMLTDPYFTQFYINKFSSYLSENTLNIIANAFSTSLNLYIFIVRKEIPDREPYLSVIFTDKDLNIVEEYPLSKLTMLNECYPDEIRLSEDGNWLMVNKPDHEALYSSYGNSTLFLYHFNPKFPNNTSPMIYCKKDGIFYADFFTHSQYGKIIMVQNSFFTGMIKLDDVFQLLETEKPTNVHTTFSGYKNGIIHEAVRNRQFEVVKNLLEDSSNLNKRGKYAFTPLHIAVLNNDIKMTELLLDHGARINEKALEGTTPILMAVLKNYSMMVHLLLEKGADPNIPTITLSSPLMYATNNNNTNIVSSLLDHGANPYELNFKYQGPLFLAMRNYEDPEMINTYLKHDVDLNQPCYGNMSPLQLAIRYNNPALIKYFIKNGADVNYCHEKSSPPLCQAIEGEQLSVIRLLLTAGADIHAKNVHGKTAEELAIEKDINLDDL